MRKPSRAERDFLGSLCSTPDHPWKKHLDVIRQNSLLDASAWGFTVVCDDGERKIELKGGLTEDMYAYLAPALSPLDQGTIAKGVLENMLQPFNFDTLICAWNWLCKTHKCDFIEEWLPNEIASNGFRPVFNMLSKYLTDHPTPHKPPQWDSCSVSYKGRSEIIKIQRNGVMNKILDALERSKWKNPTELPKDIDNVQATQAAYYFYESKKIVRIHVSGTNIYWDP